MTEIRINQTEQTNSILNRYMELLLDNEWHTLEELTRQLETTETNVYKISTLFDKVNFIEYDMTKRQAKIDIWMLDLYIYD